MNSKLTLTLAAAGLIAVAGGAGYWFANQRMGHTAPAAAPVTTVGEARKPLYYYDPMYPQQKFDKPGKSPFMDMALVPAYADEGADQGSVRISSRVAQNLGIRTAEVSSGPLERKVEVVGAVMYDERAVTVVQARVGGFIEKLFVRAPLDPVAKGQPLAEIMAPDWVAAQEEYLALKSSPQANDALRAAARQRLAVIGMPDATIAALDATGRAHPRITLVSPVSGVVGELAVREGMTVMPGAMLFRLNGLSTVWVQADIPETQAAWLVPGSAVDASVPAYPGEVFKGRVVALLPEVNAGTRTLKGRIEVANPRHRLAPGMFATVAVATPAQKAVLQVPSEAVIQTGKRSVVIVAVTGDDGRQQFAPTDVETGAEVNGMTEIRSGLAKGMKVVLSGQFLIDSEANLKTSGTRMSEAPAPGAIHHGEGRVEKVGKDSVTLSHGAIASLKMGAMTMDYKAPANVIPATLKAGTMVTFDVAVSPQGEMSLTRIEPKGGSTK